MRREGLKEERRGKRRKESTEEHIQGMGRQGPGKKEPE